MSDETVATSDPFDVLGIPSDATEQMVRARYLELVKKYPPDREPDMFRRIQAAYKGASDPLVLAEKLIAASNPQKAPSWEAVIDANSKTPPPLTVEFLVSLGNKD